MADEYESSDLLREIPEELPVIPINDGVVFPYMLVPLVLSDENLIRLVDEALAGSKIIGVFTQIEKDLPNPGPEDLYGTGCALLIQKMARFPEGHMRIIGQGLARIEVELFTDETPFMRARVGILNEPVKDSDTAKALMRNVVNAFSKIVDASENYPDELKGLVTGYPCSDSRP